MGVQYRIEKWKNPFAPHPAQCRAQLTNEGYRVSGWTERSGSVFGLRKEPMAHSRWVISGQLEIHVRGLGTFVLEAGDRDFLEADALYSVRVLGDEPAFYFIGEAQPPKRKRGRPKKKEPDPDLRETLFETLRHLSLDLSILEDDQNTEET